MGWTLSLKYKQKGEVRELVFKCKRVEGRTEVNYSYLTTDWICEYTDSLIQIAFTGTKKYNMQLMSVKMTGGPSVGVGMEGDKDELTSQALTDYLNNCFENKRYGLFPRM